MEKLEANVFPCPPYQTVALARHQWHHCFSSYCLPRPFRHDSRYMLEVMSHLLKTDWIQKSEKRKSEYYKRANLQKSELQKSVTQKSKFTKERITKERGAKKQIHKRANVTKEGMIQKSEYI